jgi:transposase
MLRVLVIIAIEAAYTLTDRFLAMIRKTAELDLNPLIAEASPSLIASFATSIIKDKAAARAAITETSSNGQTEG